MGRPVMAVFDRASARMSATAVRASAVNCFEPMEPFNYCPIGVRNTSSTDGIRRRTPLAAFVGFGIEEGIVKTGGKHSARSECRQIRRFTAQKQFI